MSSFDALVIGGGLVGSAIAWGLARQGLGVALLDEGDVAFRASRGNFGLVWVQGKGAGRPEYALWSRRSSELWPELAGSLLEETGTDVAYERPGGAVIALDEEELRRQAELLARIAHELGNAGYEYEVLDRAALAELMPGLGAEVAGGTWCPYDGHASPLLLLRALHAAIRARGGSILAGHRASRLVPEPGGGFRAETAAGPVRGERVVVAAGLGSGPLSADLGLRMPVEPVQGQIIVTERAPRSLHLPTNLVRQSAEGTFLLGSSEARVGFDVETRDETVRDIAWRAVRAWPALEHVRVVRAWAALRIMTPDGFPIYERSPCYPGAWGITCHSGVTLAAVHALEVSRWIRDDAIPPGQACFSGARFRTPHGPAAGASSPGVEGQGPDPG